MANKSFLLFMFEMLATFFFVAIGCAGLVGKDRTADSGAFGLHFGLVSMVIVHTFGFLSGALINPTVVVASVVSGALRLKRAAIYLVAEFAGALLGYYALIAILGEETVTQANLCFAQPNDDLSDAQVIGIEFLISTVLIFGLFAMLDGRNRADVMPLRSGAIVAVCVLVGVLHTGVGLNSALMTAAAVAVNNFDKLPLYLAGQFLAAIVAPFLWKYLVGC